MSAGISPHSTQRRLSPRVLISVIAVVAFWSPVAVIDTVTLRTLSPFQYSLWSSVCGALGAFVLNALRGNLSKVLSYSVYQHGRLVALSLLGFAVYFILKFTAYTMSPIPQANVLQFTFTIFIVIFAVPLLKKSVTVLKLAGVIIGFCGAAFIMSGGRLSGYERDFIHGYLFALGAGISFALFSVLAEKWSYDRFSSLFFFHFYSAVLLFIALGIEGGFTVPVAAVAWFGVLYNGIVSNVIGISLWLYALNSTDDVTLLSGLLYFVPFFALIFFRIFLHVPVPVYAYTGLVLIVGGMLLHHTDEILVRKDRSL